ncbi:unnamed protein product [Fusarium graminearum]|uniref:Uncharacterized protein n=1 Tax=Gibberella zeae TaxID=5518 RepID=A0A9N8RPB6_GIBZA|nr:unnamed protein product [Fusarium graminearum]CZS83311.1 unnamed protein product [Fusarium graminearum]
MESECSVEGDPDLYGLGVRIASYVTWFTTIFAYHIFPQKTIAAGTANTGEVYLMTVLGVGGGFAFLVEMAIMKTSMVLERWALYIGEPLKLSPFMDL